MNRSFLKYACYVLVLVVISGSVGYITGRNAALSTVTIISPVDNEISQSASSNTSNAASTAPGHISFADSASPGSSYTTNDISGAASDTSSDTLSDADSVYITTSGTKYHLAGCSYLKSSKNSIPLSEAIEKGYGPCSRCCKAE